MSNLDTCRLYGYVVGFGKVIGYHQKSKHAGSSLTENKQAPDRNIGVPLLR